MVETFGIAQDDSAILASDPWLLTLFESAAQSADAVTVANWVLHEVQRIRKSTSEDMVLTPEALTSLIAMVDSEEVAARTAKELLTEVAVSGADPRALVEERGLRQIVDTSALEGKVDEVIEQNADKAAAYRGGKKGLIGFFMGQVMRLTGGKANPEMVRAMLEERLS